MEKASDFIARVQDAINKHGDLPIRAYNEYWMSQGDLSKIETGEMESFSCSGGYEGKVLVINV